MHKVRTGRLRAATYVSVLSGFTCLAMISAAYALNMKHDRPKERELSQQAVDSLTSGQVRLFGKASAPIKVIGFMDYECPACRAHFDQVEQAIKRNANATFYIQQFPLPMHRLAKPAATLALEAEAKGILPAVHLALLAGKTLTRQTLDSVAKEYSLDPNPTNETNKELADGLKQCLRLKIQSVPSFIVSDSHSSKVCTWQQVIEGVSLVGK